MRQASKALSYLIPPSSLPASLGGSGTLKLAFPATRAFFFSQPASQLASRRRAGRISGCAVEMLRNVHAQVGIGRSRAAADGTREGKIVAAEWHVIEHSACFLVSEIQDSPSCSSLSSIALCPTLVKVQVMSTTTFTPSQNPSTFKAMPATASSHKPPSHRIFNRHRYKKLTKSRCFAALSLGNHASHHPPGRKKTFRLPSLCLWFITHARRK